MSGSEREEQAPAAGTKRKAPEAAANAEQANAPEPRQKALRRGDSKEVGVGEETDQKEGPSPPPESDAERAVTQTHDLVASIPDAFSCFDVFLFDIEGTVCPISFVKKVLFPYALKALPKILDDQWDEPNFAQYRNAFPEQYRSDRKALEGHVTDLVERDVKASYLKSLQGHLWQTGYERGELKAPLFSDVAPFMKAVENAGKKCMIYSSGSVAAQKLLFGHVSGTPSDLRPLIHDWFDTVNAGAKSDVAAYRTILSTQPDTEASKWMFFSDNLDEVDAAQRAGMQSLPLVRPGNPPLPNSSLLGSCAIQNFTSAEADKGMAALAAMRKTRELDGTM